MGMQKKIIRLSGIVAMGFILSSAPGFAADKVFQVTMETDKSVYSSGDEITVEITIRNISPERQCLPLLREEDIVIHAMDISRNRCHEGVINLVHPGSVVEKQTITAGGDLDTSDSYLEPGKEKTITVKGGFYAGRMPIKGTPYKGEKSGQLEAGLILYFDKSFERRTRLLPDSGTYFLNADLSDRRYSRIDECRNAIHSLIAETEIEIRAPEFVPVPKRTKQQEKKEEKKK